MGQADSDGDGQISLGEFSAMMIEVSQAQGVQAPSQDELNEAFMVFES